MLLNSFIGKTCLWQGQPFLARTWFEPTASDFGSDLIIRAQGLPTEATFRMVEPDSSAPMRIRSIERLAEDVLGGKTESLSPGVYEITISRFGHSVRVPEMVWVLSRENYAELTRADFAEPEMPEPLISSREGLIQHLECIKRTKWPDAPLSFEVIYAATQPFPFGRIEGLVSTVLEAFRYLAVFGMSTGASATLSIGNDDLEFGIVGALEYPVPIDVESSISDPECSDLQLLMMERAKHGEKLDFGISTEGGKAQIRVQHSMPILDYA